MFSFLESLARKLPLSLKYALIRYPPFRWYYGNRFRNVREVSVQLEDYHFEMLAPESESYIWTDYRRNQCHEPVVSRWIVNFYRQSRRPPSSIRFWDVGSKAGYYAMLAAGLGQPETVTVFEPHPAHLDVIQKNNRTYFEGRIRVEATSVDGTFSVKPFTDQNDSDFGVPDLVKIDVDGGETEALAGLKPIIDHRRTVFLIEVHLTGEYRRRKTRIETLFKEYDHRYMCLDHRNPDTTWESITSLPDRTLVPGHDYFVRFGDSEWVSRLSKSDGAGD